MGLVFTIQYACGKIIGKYKDRSVVQEKFTKCRDCALHDEHPECMTTCFQNRMWAYSEPAAIDKMRESVNRFVEAAAPILNNITNDVKPKRSVETNLETETGTLDGRPIKLVKYVSCNKCALWSSEDVEGKDNCLGKYRNWWFNCGSGKMWAFDDTQSAKGTESIAYGPEALSTPPLDLELDAGIKKLSEMINLGAKFFYDSNMDAYVLDCGGFGYRAKSLDMLVRLIANPFKETSGIKL